MDFIKMLDEYKRKCKENSRYPIELLADENGNVTLFFDVEDFQLYQDGKMVTASTERFLQDDIVHSVPKDRIERLSDGNTLAHLISRIN